MLARALPGVIVLVGTDRYLSGRLAERRLGATVHVLDDGFQHLELARAVDLLLVAEDDLQDQPLPAGRLRERISAAAVADAALITAGYDTAAERIGRAFGISPVFRVTRAIGAPRNVAEPRDSVVVPSGSQVFVVTGIARPDRFVADILSVGWEISGMIEFRDHHPFTARDVRRIAAEAEASASMLVLTTEKDAVRLAACDLGDLPIASVPLVVGVEPADAFEQWLVERIAAHREAADGTRSPSNGDPQSAPLAPQWE
jgi:tetraacyldisaccharide 4'-kinase